VTTPGYKPTKADYQNHRACTGAAAAHRTLEAGLLPLPAAPDSIEQAPSFSNPEASVSHPVLHLYRSRIELCVYLSLFVGLLIYAFYLWLVFEPGLLLLSLCFLGGALFAVGVRRWSQEGRRCGFLLPVPIHQSRQAVRVMLEDGRCLEMEGLWSLMPWLLLIQERDLAAQSRGRRRLVWPDSGTVETLRLLRVHLFAGR